MLLAQANKHHRCYAFDLLEHSPLHGSMTQESTAQICLVRPFFRATIYSPFGPRSYGLPAERGLVVWGLLRTVTFHLGSKQPHTACGAQPIDGSFR